MCALLLCGLSYFGGLVPGISGSAFEMEFLATERSSAHRQRRNRAAAPLCGVSWNQKRHGFFTGMINHQGSPRHLKYPNAHSSTKQCFKFPPGWHSLAGHGRKSRSSPVTTRGICIMGITPCQRITPKGLVRVGLATRQLKFWLNINRFNIWKARKTE